MNEIAEHLRALREDWIEIIPDSIVHSTDKPNNYKIRTSWFTGCLADISNLQREQLISDESKVSAASQFIQAFGPDSEFTNRVMNTAQDIQVANALIDIILGE